MTTVNSGTLVGDHAGQRRLPSGIGQSSNSAANLILNGGGTLSYNGPAGTVTTDRLLTLNGDAAFFSNTGAASVTFSNFGAVAGSGVLTLAGGNTGNNLFNPSITGNVGLAKNSGGLWLLGQANTFTNDLRVLNGTLNIQGFNQNTGNLILGARFTRVELAT